VFIHHVHPLLSAVTILLHYDPFPLLFFQLPVLSVQFHNWTLLRKMELRFDFEVWMLNGVDFYSTFKLGDI
jgi:hypothetical protein